MGWALLVLLGIVLVGGFAVGVIFTLFLIRPAHSLEMRANEAFAVVSDDIDDLRDRMTVLERRADGAIKIVQGHGTA